MTDAIIRGLIVGCLVLGAIHLLDLTSLSGTLIIVGVAVAIYTQGMVAGYKIFKEVVDEQIESEV